MTRSCKRAPLALAVLACAPLLIQASAAYAQTGAQSPALPQFKGPGGAYLPPTTTAVMGIDAATGAPCLVGLTATCVLPAQAGLYGGMTASLVANANAATTGTPVAHVYKDSYLFTCTATTWNSATAQLQYLGPDAATWVNFTGAALTANGVTGVGVGANATVRALVTGAPTALFCNLT